MSGQTKKVCDKKSKIAEEKIAKILSKIKSLKLSDRYISNLSLPKESVGYFDKIVKFKWWIIVAVLVVLSSWGLYSLTSEDCLVMMPFPKSLFRAPEDCGMCAGVSQVTRLGNVSRDLFEREFAYSATPVIVADAMDDWRAVEDFNFDFFRSLYKRGQFGKKTGNCAFFSYKSGFSSLSEVFDMDPARANLTAGAPWYVGWNTCYELETAALRSYYARPYFLPATAESDAVDWLFMGWPGQGAHMHVDSVRHKSWQAQVRGAKRWTLAPPPECLYACRQFDFTVRPGEILIVDTNRWYHKTEVLPGDISISIGTEYD